MSKDSGYQLELFSNPEGQDAKSPGASIHLRNFIKTYEKALLLLIAFIIIGIATFSLGVKWGAINTTTASENIKVNPREKWQLAPMPSALPAVIEKKEFKPPVKSVDYLGKYTIQLATYKDKSGAQKEAMALKKKGFSPIILPTKKYSVLCAGNFSSKETAGFLLSKLKKQYRDCFVRRL